MKRETTRAIRGKYKEALRKSVEAAVARDFRKDMETSDDNELGLFYDKNVSAYVSNAIFRTLIYLIEHPKARCLVCLKEVAD